MKFEGSCTSIFGIGLIWMIEAAKIHVFNFDSVGLLVFVQLGAINRQLTIL